MPKTPAPPLYFHLSQRLLYWQSLPPCYAQLFHPPPNEAQLDPESLPPSNAAEIGLVEEDEKLYEEVDYAAEPVSNRVEREGNEGRGAERDVRRGGYPTFSGGGMTDPKKQVPMGIVERGIDGRVVRFVGDEGGGVGRPQPRQLARAGSMPVELDRTRRDIGDSENVRRSHAETGVSLTVSKRRKEVPPADQSLCPALAPQPVRPARQLSRLRQPAPGPGSGPARSRSKAKRETLAPINEESPAISSAYEVGLPGITLASDLGKQFPLPPSRAKRESSASDILATAAVPRNTKVTEMGSQALHVPMFGASHPTRESTSSFGNSRASAEALTPSLPFPPLRAGSSHPSKVDDDVKTVAPTLNPPPPPLASPAASLARPNIVHSTSDPTSLTSIQPEPNSNTLRSSIDPSRSTSTHSRKSQGVRFALLPLSTSSIASTSTIIEAPRSGLRIPGTSIELSLPFMSAPGTPRRRRHSIASLSSDSSVGSDSETDGESGPGREMESEGERGGRRLRGMRDDLVRPESLASISSTGTDMETRPEMVARPSSEVLDTTSDSFLSGEKAGLPKREGGRPESVAVLGGGCLDGGKERRLHSSIDSIT